jgi:RNA polymerase sigma-70 factor (ECF subfamily)
VDSVPPAIVTGLLVLGIGASDTDASDTVPRHQAARKEVVRQPRSWSGLAPIQLRVCSRVNRRYVEHQVTPHFASEHWPDQVRASTVNFSSAGLTVNSPSAVRDREVETWRPHSGWWVPSMVSSRTASSPRGGAVTLNGMERSSAVGGGDHIDYSRWTDNELVAAMSKDGADAYGELFRRHIHSVTAAARVILRVGPDSEDIATEVFIQLWMSPERFDSNRGSVVGYLRTSAKHRSIDFIRSSSARRRREANDYYEVSMPPPESDARLLSSERDDLVRKSLATLPAIEREAIDIAFFSGLAYSAAAAHLGLPEGTVKSRIRSGLQRLRTSDAIHLIRETLEVDPVRSDATPVVTKGLEAT